MRMDPTHQSDSRAKLIRTADANTTPLIEDHSIPPASSSAVPDYQTRSARCHSIRWPRPALVNFFPSRPTLRAAGPQAPTLCPCQRGCIRQALLLLHRPSSRGNSLGSRRSSLCACNAQAVSLLLLLLLLCARPGQKSRSVTLPRRLNVSNQHGSQSPRAHG